MNQPHATKLQLKLTHMLFAISRCTLWPIAPILIFLYRTYYRINLNQATQKKYRSLDELFTRKIKANFTKSNGMLLSPVEAKVQQCGAINEYDVLQSKNKTYSIKTLLNNHPHTNQLKQGSFFSLYLAPHNYHRIHMPCNATLTHTCYVPGRLYSVKPHLCKKIDHLFAHNERYIMIFETTHGIMALVMVGALMVRGIETSWSSPKRVDETQTPLAWKEHNLPLLQGDDIGTFHMGSSIVLLHQQPVAKIAKIDDILHLHQHLALLPHKQQTTTKKDTNITETTKTHETT
jgi:phosphatidylserine decarboxylase